ncbi:PKD domain-containing protein, partial [Myxococcota bacterium]|nr:PKD domain-containing protein [Myxococcota bacterium]
GARVTPAHVRRGFPDPQNPGGVAWEYHNITVPSGGTVAFLTVIIHEQGRLDALAEVYNLLRMNPIVMALDNLSAAERRAVLNFDIDPTNGSPLADAGGTYNAQEGATLQFSAAGSSDPEGLSLSYQWDLDDDGVFEEVNSGSSAQLTFPDDGRFRVGVRVTDEGGKSDVDYTWVNVQNVSPSIDGINTDAPVGEGEIVTIEVRVVEQGTDDTLSFDFDWEGDGVFDALGLTGDPRNPGERTYTFTTQHRYMLDGDFQPVVVVHDDDGGEAERSFGVFVSNLPPNVRQVIAPSPALEGDLLTVHVIADDPGADEITYAYDFITEGAFSPDVEGEGLNETQTRYPDNDVYTLTVQVCDAQGACAEFTKPISVLNAAPSILGIAQSGPIEEGAEVIITVAADDPGDDELSYSFDFDGDGVYEITDGAAAEVRHTYTQQGRFEVGVRVRDDDGEAGDIALETVTVEVTNVAPIAGIFAPVAVDEGATFEIVVTALDPGDDTLSYDWDLDGDGEYEVLATNSGTIQTSLPQDGEYTLRCRVNDGDGGVAEVSTMVRARNVPPTLTVELPEEGDEGAEIAIRGLTVDPGDDELRYAFDFNYTLGEESVFEIEGSLESVARWRFPDQGAYTVRVVVDDGANQVDAYGTINIANVDPTVTLTSNSPLMEGATLILTATVYDPGDDTISLGWDFDGDGVLDGESVAEGEEVVFEARAGDDGRFLAEVIVADEDGGEGRANTVLIISNANPRFVGGIDIPSAVEGSAYRLVIPAEDPAGRGDPVVFSLIDPPGDAAIDEVTGELTWMPSYEDYLNSPAIFTARIDDDDGGFATQEYEIVVLPKDEDRDGLPDTYEAELACFEGVCLDPTNPNDATEDPDGDGRDNATEWAQGTAPFEYDGPEVPTLSAPEDGAQIHIYDPELVILPTGNTLETPVFIELQVFDAPSPDSGAEAEPLIQSEEVLQAAEAEDVRWPIPEGVLWEDRDYVWRARARSGSAVTRWSDTWGFHVNALNQNPTAPIAHAPADGSVVSDLRPSLEVLPATDGDGDQLNYVFRLYHDDQVESSVVSPEAGAEVIRLQPNANLVENGVYEWDVVARDIDYATAPCPQEVPANACGLSPPSARWRFVVNTEAEGPSKPILYEPQPYSDIDTLEPVFLASDSVDPDTPEVLYVFRLRDEAGELLEESAPIAAEHEDSRCRDGLCAAWVPTALEEDHTYIVDVHATDGERVSATSDPAQFTVSVQDDPPPIPQPVSPIDAARVPLDGLVLNWTGVLDPEGLDVTYQATVCDQAGVCLESLKQTGLGFRLDNKEEIIKGETYIWHVEAFDAIQGSGISEAWTFTVEEGGASGGAGGDDEGCGCVVGAHHAAPYHWLLLSTLLLGLRRRRRR